VKQKSGGLLLPRRITPLPRRHAVYFCSGAYKRTAYPGSARPEWGLSGLRAAYSIGRGEIESRHGWASGCTVGSGFLQSAGRAAGIKPAASMPGDDYGDQLKKMQTFFEDITAAEGRPSPADYWERGARFSRARFALERVHKEKTSHESKSASIGDADYGSVSCLRLLWRSIGQATS